MAKVVRFRHSARVQEGAALWLARLDRGLSGEDRAALDAWLSEDPSHRNALLELASFWDELDVLADLSELFPLEQPVRAAPNRAERRWLLAGSAATLVAATLGVGLFVVSVPRLTPVEKPRLVEDRSETFETAVGGHAMQQLSDGSVITLNTDTEIRVAFVEQSRDIFLRRGEAHFDVVSDPSRPFRVHVAGRTLQAVGTAFNVQLRVDGGIEVTVTEGAVKVANADGATERLAAAPVLAAAFEATVTEGGFAILDESATSNVRPPIVQLEPVDMDMKLAWQRGMLIFRGESLQQMLDEVERYTTTEFVLEGAELNDLRVGGYFRAGDIDSLLLALRENFQIEAEHVGVDRIVLRAVRTKP